MYSGNSYKKFPEFYDLLYQRYLKSVPDFVALVEKNTPQKGLILDLAAGTGEITIPLLKKGFRVISLDASQGMLRELKLKAKKQGIKKYQVTKLDMQKISYQKKFDSVCIRQAINYFMGSKALAAGLKKIFASLKTGGKFIFNAPNYQGEKKYPALINYYKKGEQQALVVETNKITGQILKHRQHSALWKTGQKSEFIIDENSFYLFTRKEFARALKKSGFSKIKLIKSAKTLYFIAIK
ncbi:MAG: class I SAM-dependent methyltransferase [Patescibacteria group bacterium]|nr:class I SAM-dependent methyltransferase [Patescibacteria group bacterium]